VVGVGLGGTGVGAEKVREMNAVCKTNKERREAAATYFINQAIKLLGLTRVKRHTHPSSQPASTLVFSMR